MLLAAAVFAAWRYKRANSRSFISGLLVEDEAFPVDGARGKATGVQLTNVLSQYFMQFPVRLLIVIKRHWGYMVPVSVE